METQVATRQKQDLFTLSPKSLEEAMQYAGIIAESELVPKDYRQKPGNVLVAVQMGGEIGLPPMQALQNIAVINGRPSLWGDALKAVVMAHPLCEYIKEWFDETTKTAWCETKRVGSPEPHREAFSFDDAKAASLLGKQGPWQQYPKRMCKMRARGFCLRDTYPDVLKGIASAEELQDMEKDVTGGEGGKTSLKPKPRNDDFIDHDQMAGAKNQPAPQANPFDQSPLQDHSISKETLLKMIAACKSPQDFNDVKAAISKHDPESMDFAQLVEAFNRQLSIYKSNSTQEH